MPVTAAIDERYRPLCSDPASKKRSSTGTAPGIARKMITALSLMGVTPTATASGVLTPRSERYCDDANSFSAT